MAQRISLPPTSRQHSLLFGIVICLRNLGRLYLATAVESRERKGEQAEAEECPTFDVRCLVRGSHAQIRCACCNIPYICMMAIFHPLIHRYDSPVTKQIYVTT